LTRFWWVRHGPTHAKGIVGWTDLAADLSDVAALARLNIYLPSDAVVISSDLARAVTTADAIQMQRPRLPHDPALREIHFGLWEMRNFAEVEVETPDLIRAFWDQPGVVAPPSGECWNDMSNRVAKATDRLAASHIDRDVIVVAHFGAIIAALEHALRIPTTVAFGHKIDNLSVTRIDLGAGTVRVHAINHKP
jgi:alpha-ribazole phosphatase